MKNRTKELMLIMAKQTQKLAEVSDLTNTTESFFIRALWMLDGIVSGFAAGISWNETVDAERVINFKYNLISHWERILREDADDEKEI